MEHEIPYLPSPALREADQGLLRVVPLACEAILTRSRRIVALLLRPGLGAPSNPCIAAFVGPLTLHGRICYFQCQRRD